MDKGRISQILHSELRAMTEQPQKYPLAWPDNIPRSSVTTGSAFKSTLAAALANVKKSLELFGKDTGKTVSDIVLSSNVGGLDPGKPTDAGVAAWFIWEGQLRCIAVDRYDKVEHNLQAIHHILEARRTEMRHGGLNIVRQTFKAFAALPAPKGRPKWFQVLGVPENADISLIEAEYRKKAREFHPDRTGGSASVMSALNAAVAEGRKARAAT
jgi:hypothetical protein